MYTDEREKNMNRIGLYVKKDSVNSFGIDFKTNINLWYLSYDGEKPLTSNDIFNILGTTKWDDAQAYDGNYIKSDADAISIYKEVMTKLSIKK